MTDERITLREAFLRLDERLVARGVFPVTAWWREHVGAWLDAYESRSMLEFWACVGRGAMKSTVIYRLAIFFSVFVPITVPVGERHYAIVLSRLKEEATKGLSIISHWLTLLGIAHHPTGDVIDLDDSQRGIRVVAASVAATSGWRAFFVAEDERSKWPSGGVDDQDANEIDTSAIAMGITYEAMPIIRVGSMWSSEFNDVIRAGSDENRYVAGPAPTWIAAPYISEASTRRRERDPKRWAREYACIFDATGSSALDVQALQACIRELHPLAGYLDGPEIVIDSSGGTGRCAFVIGVLAYITEPSYEAKTDAAGNVLPIHGDLPPPITRLALLHMEAFEEAIAQSMSTSDVAARIAEIAHRWGASRVHGDQFGAWGWQSELGRLGLTFETTTWNAQNKIDALLRLRQLIREKLFVIDRRIGAEAGALINEARTFEERILPSGVISIGARGRANDDRIMAVMLGAAADTKGRLRGSPLHSGGWRYSPDEEAWFGDGGEEDDEE